MIDRENLLRAIDRPIFQWNRDHHNNIRRRTEDVDYWRKRAGWFDDDVKMKEYNDGVYDTFYSIDDDGAGHHSSTGGVFSGSASKSDMSAMAVKVVAVVVCLVLCILMFRVITRRLGESKKDKKKKKASGSSRSRSKSRSRSRSRARKKEKDSDYDLLEGEDGEKSRKSGRSSRSKSRSRRSSRSRSRARSHSRSRKEKSSAPPAEPILV